MISQKRVVSCFVSFATKRLLDLSRAYLISCQKTLESTQLSDSLVRDISWFKFDRIAKIAAEYAARNNLDELISVDTLLLSSIIEQVSLNSPCSDEAAAGTAGPRRQSSCAYQAYIYESMKVIVASVVHDMRRGSIDSGVAHLLGIDPEVVWSLAMLHSSQCWQVAYLYADRTHYQNFFRVDAALLERQVAATRKRAIWEEKLERFIMLGASQRHIKHEFGASVRNTTIAERKRFLHFTGKQEDMRATRFSSLTSKQCDFIYDHWVRNLELPTIDRYIAVAQMTRFKINVVEQVIRDLDPVVSAQPVRCA